MARERKGSVVERNKSIYARVQFKGTDGKKRDIWRKASSRKHAREIIRQILCEIDDYGETPLDGARKTFADLAAYYRAHYLKPAAYVGERKVSGLRSLATAEGHIAVLSSHFGHMKLRSLSYDDIRAFRDLRLRTTTRRGKGRAIATVNRELALLRRILGVATRQGWILKNPFAAGDSLISLADEVRRERTLTAEEEKRLLDACTGRRKHLKPLLIAALDTACRRGELLKLKWCDVDFMSRTVTIRAMNTKTARARIVAMTPRLYSELERLQYVASESLQADALVFGVKDNIKNAFTSACKAAGIRGFRFHDCRHTAITRMVAAGIPPVEVMKISGHTQWNTFARYVNPNTSAILRAAELLAAFNELPSGDKEAGATVEFVN